MLKVLQNESNEKLGSSWLKEYWTDFRRRFVSLLSFQFHAFLPVLALSLLQNKNQGLDPPQDLSVAELRVHLTPYDIKRLELYTKNMADYHLIMDLVPTLSKLFFINQLGPTHLSVVQSVS